ncbi:MAG TPA: HEAT repeat domain-containing protein, partial [Verrucomicrobiae bacterium]|nr:HEAT repeat domain-containing protein [Verrucomicrobiae bacterium]
SLSHKDSYVRGNAAWSLGRFGSGAKAAVPALKKALEDSDAYVRRQATNALKSIDSGTIASAGPAK